MNRKAIRWVVEDPQKKNVFWPSEDEKPLDGLLRILRRRTYSGLQRR